MTKTREITAKAAEDNFDALLDEVQKYPMVIVRENGEKLVMISADMYEMLTGKTL